MIRIGALGNYILDEHGEPAPCPDFLEWAAWFATNDRAVASTEVNGLRVSTVFLGIDHNFFGGVPLLFETMIFPLTDAGARGSALDYQERYATRAEAIAGHTRAVDWVLAGC